MKGNVRLTGPAGGGLVERVDDLEAVRVRLGEGVPLFAED